MLTQSTRSFERIVIAVLSLELRSRPAIFKLIVAFELRLSGVSGLAVWVAYSRRPLSFQPMAGKTRYPGDPCSIQVSKGALSTLF